MSEYRYRAPVELDLAATPQLRADLYDAIEHTTAHILVDCSDLTFIDSSGIAALVSAHRALEADGRHLLVTNIGPAPRRVFEILGLTDFFRFDRDHSVLA